MSEFILEMGLSNALLATILAIVACGVTRRMRPQWALAVWLLVLAKLLMPPLWTVPLGSVRAFAPAEESTEFVAWPADEPIVFPPADAALPSPEFVVEFPLAVEETVEAATPRWSLPQVILLAWLTGALLWCLLAARRIHDFTKLLRQTRLAPVALQADVAALAAEIGLLRAPELRITRRRIAPLVWAFGRRATILLPAALADTLSADERQALLLHELAHLRRRDHLTKLVELAAVAVYWWLPTAWWTRRQADRATEGCCDAEVVARLPDGARSYASALVKTIDFLSGPTEPLPLGASGFSQFRHVSRRIEMILEPAPVSRSLWRHRLAMIALAITVLPLSLSSLWADPPLPDESETDLPPPIVETSSEAERNLGPLPIASGSERAAQHKADQVIWHDGPFEYEENPKAKYRFSPDTSLSAELNLAKTLYLAQHAAKSDAVFKQYYGKKSLHEAQAELARLEQKATKKGLLKMVEIRDHLRTHLASMEKQFAAGEAPGDKLIEIQQQFADQEAALARAICSRDWSGELLRMQANYMISCEALNRAQRTWKHVYQGSGNVETATEALAREHFYQCKQQLQNVVQAACGDFIQHVKEAEPDRDMRREASAALGAEWRMFAVTGPTTTGPQIGKLEPPTDDNILEALNHKLFADGSSPVDGNVRIVKELRTTYTDEPRAYPEVGEAQRHHAIYKVTVDYVEKGGKPTVEVVYMDHQHLHRVSDAAQQAQLDELEAQTRQFMFGERTPHVEKVRVNDGAASEVPPAGGEFELSEQSGKDWNSNDGMSVDRKAFETQAKVLADEVKRKFPLIETNAKRRESATRQVSAMETAFETGTVTIDQLLESQRRHADAQAAYYQAILQSDSDSDEHRRLLHEANVIVTQEAMNSARRTWQKVYAKYRRNTSGGNAVAEAQAREQFYQFKQQFERARRGYQEELERQRNSPKEETSQGSRPPTTESEKLLQAEMNRVSILGPITSGEKPTTLDPPSDEEVTLAWRQKRNSAGRPTPGKNIRIVKELVATYTDPPRFFPLIGKGQMHHAHYKCTVYYDASQGKPQEEVVYVDHNHLHQQADSRSFEEFQSGPLHYKVARGITKERVQFRHFQMQLAREKAKLADLKEQIVAAPTTEQQAELSRLEMRIARRQQELDATAHKVLRNALNPGREAKQE